MTTFVDYKEYSVTDYKGDRNHYWLKQKKYKTKNTLSWKKNKGVEEDTFSTNKNLMSVSQIKQEYNTSYYFPRKWILGEHKKNKGKMGKRSWTLRAYTNNNYIRSIVKDSKIILT